MFEDRMAFDEAPLIDDPLTGREVGLWLERVLGFRSEDVRR